MWDPSSGQISYASGGHNPPLLIDGETGQVRDLPATGIALGILPGIELQPYSVEMKPGDTLVAYTDGVTEAMQDDYTEWGMENFKDLLADTHRDSAQKTVDRILSTIESFVAGAPQSDDLTLWLLKRSHDHK
ncbi:MAG: serine/threonine-protein phosphatase [Chloroflexi bacterium]|nr:serine/threonine-protein phosphatase [Chloroflexota bacterium]